MNENTNEAQSQIQQIEITIDQAKASIRRGEAIQRLHSHTDFKEVVMEGYFHKEAIRLTHLLSSPNAQGDREQQKIVNELRAIGSFASYLDTAMRHAAMAHDAITQGEQELTEAYQEEQYDKQMQATGSGA